MDKKQKSRAFSKDVFLLGKDEEGICYWLEAPSWDCGWYWGFGYITSYQGNRLPDKASDISSHEHADNFLSEWFTEWNGSKPRLKTQVFTEKEGWELCELFKQFYILNDTAEFFGRGKAHVADTSIPNWKDEKLAKDINTRMIPAITSRIMEILTP
jgi:hypothetical protein